MKSLIQSFVFALGMLISTLVWSVDINSADAKTLAAELQGVGKSRAEAIVQYRNQHGAFKSAKDLLKVKGIGPGILKKNQEKIVVSSKK